ncbi:MAG: YceI family protein [Chitinophagales bacterium]
MRIFALMTSALLLFQYNVTSIAQNNHNLKEIAGTTWTINSEKSSATFETTSYLKMKQISGKFQNLTGEITIDSILKQSKVDISLGVKSLKAAENEAYLLSDEFFDADTHASIQFESEKIGVDTDACYVAIGNLNIKNIKQQNSRIRFVYKGLDQFNCAHFVGTAYFNRKKHKVGSKSWNSMDDKVKITLDIIAEPEGQTMNMCDK